MAPPGLGHSDSRGSGRRTPGRNKTGTFERAGHFQRLVPAMFKTFLQQAGGTKALNRIRYSYRLTFKNAARHRDPQGRVSQMPDLHE
jgi:hypothetical protein